MRRPTPNADLFAWHVAALREERPAVHEDEPQCGWFRRRFIPTGPWVPVRIEMERHIDEASGDLWSDETLLAVTGGPKDFTKTRAFDAIVQIWIAVARHPISESAYHALAADAGSAWYAPVDVGVEPVRPQ